MKSLLKLLDKSFPSSFTYLFIFRLGWVFIAACGLSLVATSGGCSPFVVHGLLIAVASLVEEHRL